MMRAIKLAFLLLAVLLLDAAIVLLPDGQIVSGDLDSWADYSDGDQIQVVIDGKTYLVHANNVTLISD